jgi:3-deoxy-D-manno-octulosonic-acid transferase
MRPFCRAVLFGIYAALWRIAAPVLARHSRLRGDFRQRLHPEQGPIAAFRDLPSSPGGDRPLRLWIQAASAGEARLVPALLSALQRVAAEHPHFAALPIHVLACTCTRQGLEILNGAKETSGLCPERPGGLRLLNAPTPLDRPDIMRDAVRLAAPDILILLETELWPGLLRAAGDAGIPVLLLNARLSKKSARAYGLMRFFWRSLAPDRIAAVSAEDACRFAELFGNPEHIAVLPNIKFDLARPPERDDPLLSGTQAEERGSRDPLRPASDEAGMRPCPPSALPPAECAPVLLLASVREEEESMLLPVIRSLYDEQIQGRRVTLIIAPRHMHRITAWEDGLRAAGLPVRRTSRRTEDTSGNPTGRTNARSVLLLDSFGELRAVYGAVDAAFVGGSLAPLGGQNFLEAAGAGVPTLVGPYLDNFRWVGEDVFDAGLVRRVADAGELREALLAVLTEQAAKLFRTDGSVAEARAAAAAERRARFRALIGPKSGGALLSARLVLEHIPRCFMPDAVVQQPLP